MSETDAVHSTVQDNGSVIDPVCRWQPIETAPKDGTPILIWQPDKAARFASDFDDLRYAIGYWRTDGRESWGNRNSSEVCPTHWQPLPLPPPPDDRTNAPVAQSVSLNEDTP